MTNLIPAVNSSGKFKLAIPLDTYLNNDIIYKVIANRTIVEMVDDGLDILNDVYLILGLTDVNYNTDLKNNIIITVLKSESNDTFYIPSNMFVSIPDITGIRYIQKTVGVNLGYLPIDLNLDFILPEINDLVETLVGVVPNSSLINTSQLTVYTQEDHDIFNNARLIKVTNKETCIGQLIKIQSILNEMKIKEKILVDRLIALGG